jgi:hypothetical protein
MQNANAKELVKRAAMFFNNNKQVTLLEVESCQHILSKDLIKHANKVLRYDLWVSYISGLRQEF